VKYAKPEAAVEPPKKASVLLPPPLGLRLLVLALALGHDDSCLNNARRAVAQLARVPVSKTGGWGFKSLLPCKTELRRLHDRSTSTANINARVDVIREVRHVVDEKHDTEAGKEKLGLFGRINLFYRQVVAELRKVVWPTKKQLTTYTAVVFVFVGFIIAVVSILDVALTKIVFWIFG
jgi:preprotein translocase subunit SecE